MLETPQERVKLLKAGINGKTIETLYLVLNNFKVVHGPVLLNQVDIDSMGKKDVPERRDLSKSNPRIIELDDSSHVKIEHFLTNLLWNKAKV